MTPTNESSGCIEEPQVADAEGSEWFRRGSLTKGSAQLTHIAVPPALDVARARRVIEQLKPLQAELDEDPEF